MMSHKLTPVSMNLSDGTLNKIGSVQEVVSPAGFKNCN